MDKIAKNHFDIGYMDTLADGDSPLHRLDPRAKLITTLFFVITVISFSKYTLLAFTPFLLYPVVMVTVGGLPAGYLVRKVMFVIPFAVMLGMFNPLLDREIVAQMGSVSISGGWISFFSILIRFFLTVSAVMLLLALTGFNSVCEALTRFGVPRPFVVQLLFFYRYLFVLTDELQRMERARWGRSFHSGAMRYRTYISLIGHLLLRTLDRAERIYRAMCCRGFNGHLCPMKSFKSRWQDFGFVVGWMGLFIVFRVYNVPMKLGEYVAGYLQ